MKARLGQKGPLKILDWQHGIFGKKIPSSLSEISRNILESFGLYLEESPCGPFGWEGMTSSSTTIGGMLRNLDKWYVKVSLNTPKLHGTLQ